MYDNGSYVWAMPRRSGDEKIKRRNAMKLLILILGSTTLVAGGTAITSQQDAHNNVTAHQRPYQEHRASSRGTDCPPVATPIFDNVAYPLAIDFCEEFFIGRQDVNGDGTVDGWECYFSRFGGPGCKDSNVQTHIADDRIT